MIKRFWREIVVAFSVLSSLAFSYFAGKSEGKRESLEKQFKAQKEALSERLEEERRINEKRDQISLIYDNARKLHRKDDNN